MNQWASQNPELAEQGIGYADAHVDLADREKPAEAPLCPECRCEPSYKGGRCFKCRGESMQP